MKGVNLVHNQSNRPVDCLEEFVQRHEDRVYRTAIAIMGNKADAEDVMQDVFLKLNQWPGASGMPRPTAIIPARPSPVILRVVAGSILTVPTAHLFRFCIAVREDL